MAASLANGWTDQYGAMHVAAGYCGLSLASRYTVNGIWHHGCIGPWFDYSPALLALNTPDAQRLPVFVGRKDQEALLQAEGYRGARAIGLPIVYVKTPSVTRIPGSLLVVPTHTLVGDRFSDRTAFERYAEEIRQLTPEFTRVVVCVHPSCRKNGFWIDEFSRRGFEIVEGAQSDDLNALPRMKMLFEEFESVTTNGWGSHVAYALAFGARVSIRGTQPARSEADLLRDTTWAADRRTLEIARSKELHERRDAFLRALLVAPTAGVADVAMGNALIGADLKLQPEDLRVVLEHLVDPRPASESDLLATARRSRDEIVSQTRVLIRTGRKREAIQTLLRMVNVDVATKNPALIHASLCHAAAEIAPLEPGLATKLRGEAHKLAVAHGLQPAWRMAG